MGDQHITSEEALQLHKRFLQELLQDMMKVFDTGNAGVERMIKGLRVYWDSNHQRAATRRTVLAATAGTPYENQVEPMGRPFQAMIRAELLASGIKDSQELSQMVYEEARQIALEEALTGKRKLKRREKLIARIPQ